MISRILKFSHCPRATVMALAVGLVFTGCGHNEGGHATTVPEATGVTFKAGKGLHVPTETARFIGLRVEDVTERKVTSALDFTAQIYRAALASGSVRQSEAAALRVGLDVTALTAGGQSVPARISAIYAGSGETNGSVEVLLTVDAGKVELPPGSFLSVRVATGADKPVISVPTSALLRTAEGNFVYTISGERFVRAPVKLGVTNPEFAEVTDGLYAGDQIVAQPVMTLWMAELQSIRGGQACADGH